MTTEEHITYDLSLLEESERAWNRSGALRAFYGDLFTDMAASCRPGRSLEIGSGIAKSKEFIPHLTTSDIVRTPYVDLAMSAYAIETQGKPWANILATDVLHHLTEPLRFFQSASSALQPGGRLILAEPAATGWGKMFYRLCHHEPCLPHLIQPPFIFSPDPGSNEFANMGMAVALFRDQESSFLPRLTEMGLSLTEVWFRDFIAYPLTGGFSRQLPIPAWCIRFQLGIERMIPQTILRRLGLRCLVVLEKNG